MSFLGTREDAKRYSREADMQIDGNETSNTSPVLNGSSDPGGAPMSGKKEFSHERTRASAGANSGGLRREYK